MAVSNAAKASTDHKTVLQQAHAIFYEKKYAEAAALYRKLLEEEQNDFLIWGNLGIALRYQNYFETAAACLKRADELHPDSSAILRHYAHCLGQLNRKDEALRAFEAALRITPHDFNNHVLYAFALREFGMNEEALTHYNAALAIEPEHLEARWERADVYLRLGKFGEGWKEFETRWKLGRNSLFWAATELEKTYTSQRWTGEDLNGLTLLVYAEQGFGDTILCSRYLPLLKVRGARVIFRCPPELHRLFLAIPGIDRLMDGLDAGEKIDYHVPLMSLPGLFGTEVNSIPPAPPLHVPAAPPAEAARLLDLAQDSFKVGIVWAGRSTFVGNYKRAVPLARFLPLAEIPGVQLYSLQKGPGENELAACGAEGLVLELGPHLKDFADTAAVLKKLDLVIMTDSSVAHLAGSIGCPVWNLLSNGAYWVYLEGRDDSPWYPSLRLFRQPAPGDWDSVFEKVAAELTKVAALKKIRQGLK